MLVSLGQFMDCRGMLLTTIFTYRKGLYICVLRWFGHMERMDEYRISRRVLMAEVSGGQVQGRPRLGWMDGVKVALGNRGMTM